MISHQHKCIFIHIPKCGGTSLENIIWPEPRKTSDLWMGFVSKYHNQYQTGGLQHLTAKLIRQVIGAEKFEEYYKFTIVRNPWDKAVSQFFYMQHRPDLRDFIGMKEDDSFKKYLQFTMSKPHVQWEKQHRFFQDDNGEKLVNYLGRLECFQKDATVILDHLNILETIPHVNATQHRHYSEYYDEESKEMIADHYREDIQVLGYSFDEAINKSR